MNAGLLAVGEPEAWDSWEAGGASGGGWGSESVSTRAHRLHWISTTVLRIAFYLFLEDRHLGPLLDVDQKPSEGLHDGDFGTDERLVAPALEPLIELLEERVDPLFGGLHELPTVQQLLARSREKEHGGFTMHHTYFAFTRPVTVIYPMELLEDFADEDQKQFEMNQVRLREDFQEMSVEEMDELVREQNELAMLIYRRREARETMLVSHAVCWTIVGFWPRGN